MVKVKVFSLIREKGVNVLRCCDSGYRASEVKGDCIVQGIKEAMVAMGLDPAEYLALVGTWDYEFMDKVTGQLRTQGSNHEGLNLSFLDVQTRLRSSKALSSFLAREDINPAMALDSSSLTGIRFTYYLSKQYENKVFNSIEEAVDELKPHRVI